MTPIEWLLLFISSASIGMLAYTIAIFSARINVAYKEIAKLKNAKPYHAQNTQSKIPRTMHGSITLYDKGRSVTVKARFDRNRIQN